MSTCRRCLIRDMNREDLRLMIEEWISHIPKENRAASDLVKARLRLCMDCSHLQNGTCQLCGCYVEYRAAHRYQSCPDLPKRWEQE